MKKILMVSTLDIWPIGYQRSTPVIWQTIKGFLKDDWEIYFVAGFQPDYIAKSNDKIHVVWFDAKWIKNLMKYRKIGFFARATWWFIVQVFAFFKSTKLLHKYKIECIYCWDIYSVPVGKFLSIIYKVPLITRILGTSIILDDELGKKLWKIKRWVTILAYKIPADLFIMTNDGTQGDRVLKKLNVNMDKVKFWVNGVDKAIFDPNFNKDKFKEKLGIKKNEKILLAVSRLAKWKRVDRIIKAIPRVVKKYPEIKLLIIGGGEERKNLEKLAKELKVKDYIEFLGPLPHQDLKNYYNLADIFISMYDISNVGNPLLEAMSCGKCIITLDVGDTNKFIQNGKTGIVLSLNQLKYLSDVIVDLLKNEEKRELLGKNAKEFADENLWNWEERIDIEIREVKKLLKPS